MKTRIFLTLALLSPVFTVAFGNNSPKQTAGSEWIDLGFAKVLQQKGYIANANTVTPADVAEIIKVDVDWAELTSLRGIEYFESLQELDCGFNKLTTLDVSRNTKLTMLSCQKNRLTALDVSCNPQLIDLTCFGNKLTALDVSGNPRLMWFNCWDNQLTALDVSGNPLLMWLNCYGNQLSGLDISNNKQLTDLTCHDNPGADGRFVVEAWFDNSDVPSSITGNTDYKSSWVYKGRTVKIDYTISNRWIDPDFAKVLQDKGYIADANTVTPADVAEITWVVVDQSSLTSLKGIEYFVSLKELSCSWNQLKSLDLSKNPRLTRLYCWGNQLKSLDLSKNPRLTRLYCWGNQLTTLDVSNNPHLTQLYCWGNQLTTLDVTRNQQLKTLLCDSNPGDNGQFRVKAWFDNSEVPSSITGNTDYKSSWVYKGKAVKIDYTISTNNRWIDPGFAKVLQDKGYIADANTVTPADVAEITEVYVDESSLTSLRGIEYFASLKELQCAWNQLTTLDVSKNPQLTELCCYDNQLAELDVSRNPQLTELRCGRNQLTVLDVSKNLQLKSLWCYGNQLTVLDVSNNPQLTELRCHDNQLTRLDVSNNSLLTELCCGGNQLTVLDVSNNTQLMKLWCDESQLTTLDISSNPQLTMLWCSDNQLKSLDVCNNPQLTTLLCYGNPGANGQFRVKAWFDNSNVPSSITDDKYYKSSWKYDGKTVKIDYWWLPVGSEWIDPDFAKVLQQKGYIADANTVTPADVADITKVDVYKSSLTSLRGIEYFVSLRELQCSRNQLTTLDLSSNTQLTVLWCSNNNITSLDVSRNPQLTELDCGKNQLTQLNVGNNTQLTKLYCYKNQLTMLDVSRNLQLKWLDCYDNPGANGKFLIKIASKKSKPSSWTTSWKYNGKKVKISYYNW